MLLPDFIDESTISSVCISRLSGSGEDCGVFDGRTNGDRPTYRFTSPGAGYLGNLFITEVTGTVCEITIFDNAARQD